MEGPHSFIRYLGQRLTTQSANQWPSFVLIDPHWFMFHARPLSLEDMAEMKVALAFIDFIDQQCDCGTHLH